MFSIKSKRKNFEREKNGVRSVVIDRGHCYKATTDPSDWGHIIGSDDIVVFEMEDFEFVSTKDNFERFMTGDKDFVAVLVGKFGDDGFPTDIHPEIERKVIKISDRNNKHAKFRKGKLTIVNKVY